MVKILWLVLLNSILLFRTVSLQAQEQHNESISALTVSLKKSQQDTDRVNLLLQLSDHYFLKHGTRKSDLDSSLSYALSAEGLSTTLNYKKGLGNSYAQISKIAHISNDTAKGKYYAHKAIEIFKANKYLMELGYAWFDLSGYYALSSNSLAERVRILEQQSLPAFQQAGSKLKQADILKELADLQQIQGNYSGALSNLKHALLLYQSIGYPNLQGVYDLMGHISSLIGNDEHAIKYGLLAIKSADRVKDTSLQLATIYNRVGSTYDHMKKYQLAYQYFQKSLLIAQKYNDIETIIILTSNISHVLVESAKPAESLALLKKISRKYPTKDIYLQLYLTSDFLNAYKELKQYRDAQQYCDQLLNLSLKLDKNDPEQVAVHYPVTEFYMATQQYALARKHLAVTEAFYNAIQSPLKLSKNHLLWFKIDSIQGNYVAAIGHYQRYVSLRDSSLNETTSRQIEQLQIEFETEKKDKDILVKQQNIDLLTNYGRLQFNQVQNERFTKNITLAGIVLLFILLVLLYKNLQHRLRINKQLRSQQIEIEKKNSSLQHLLMEKDWLVKEIHHRVKNNLHTVTGLLDTQSSFLKTGEARSAIRESQNRVIAMSLIHQKLYQSENLSDTAMVDYIHELVEYLKVCFGRDPNIRFNLQVQRMELHISHSLPLGLILNEAITNAIKYAFPGNKEGTITISLQQAGENNFLLCVEDNGIGLPVGFDIQKNDSMGMNLMRGLCAEIDGDFSIINSGGTRIEIKFTYTHVPGKRLTINGPV